jgi:hypothetical protein
MPDHYSHVTLPIVSLSPRRRPARPGGGAERAKRPSSPLVVVKHRSTDAGSGGASRGGPFAILAVGPRRRQSANCGDALRPRDFRPLGRIAAYRPKSRTYNRLHLLSSRPCAGPPRAGVGAHLAPDLPHRLPVLICQHQYTGGSTYRANRSESARCWLTCATGEVRRSS